MSKVVSGDVELIRKLRSLKSGVGNGMDQVVMAGANTLEGIIKQSMNKGPHGRTYRRGGKVHRASAPGEPPAIDFGHLINSLQSELVASTAGMATAAVQTNAEYGPALEYGTARVAARPFMRPPLDERINDISRVMGATAVRLINEATR